MLDVEYTILDGEILSETTPSSHNDYLLDPLGNVIGKLDSNQNITEPREFWPFGQQASGTAPAVGALTFIGSKGYMVDHAGFYVRMRVYSDNLSTWRSMDPLWPNELSYAYVNGEPVRYADPSGLACSASNDDDPCSPKPFTTNAACIALFCSMKSSYELYVFVKKMANLLKGTWEKLYKWMEENKNSFTSDPVSSAKECCKKIKVGKISVTEQLVVGGKVKPPKITLEYWPALIKILCSKSFLLGSDFLVDACVKTSKDFDECYNCCQANFIDSEGNYSNVTKLCELRCQSNFR